MQKSYRVVAPLALALLAACADTTTPTAPPSPSDPGQVAAAVGTPEMRELGRAIAMALAAPDARIALRDAMRQSPVRQHRLLLQSFAQTEAGAVVLARAAESTGSSVDELRALVAKAPELDLFVAGAHARQTWRATEDVMVVPSVEPAVVRSGFAVTGELRALALDAPAESQPVYVILEPARVKARRLGAQTALAGDVIQDANDGSTSMWEASPVDDGSTAVRDLWTPARDARYRARNADGVRAIAPASGGMQASILSTSVSTWLTSLAAIAPLDNSVATTSEFELRATYYDGFGNGVAQSTIHKDSPGCGITRPVVMSSYGPNGTPEAIPVNGAAGCDDYWTGEAELIARRVRDNSRELIEIQLLEEDPFSPDDDLRNSQIRYYTNGHWICWRSSLCNPNSDAGARFIWNAVPRYFAASSTTTPASTDLAASGTVALVSRPLASNGTEIVDVPATWESFNPAVATVSSSGVVTAVGGGSVLIASTVDGIRSTARVKVAACGESSCTTINSKLISHFSGPNCTGTEYYYTQYNNADGIRRSWDGKGVAGTTLQSANTRSWKQDDSNQCRPDPWGPSGNTLPYLVRVYRSEVPCGEAGCTPLIDRYISHFTNGDCTGTEYYYTGYFSTDGKRRSWDGNGLAGNATTSAVVRSWKSTDPIDGVTGCRVDAWPSGNNLPGVVRIYR